MASLVEKQYKKNSNIFIEISNDIWIHVILPLLLPKEILYVTKALSKEISHKFKLDEDTLWNTIFQRDYTLCKILHSLYGLSTPKEVSSIKRYAIFHEESPNIFDEHYGGNSLTFHNIIMKIIKCHSIVQSPNYSFRRIDHALNYLSIGIDMIFTNKESYPLVAINGNTSNTNLFCDLETYFITFYAMLDPAFTKLWKYRAAFYYSAEIKIKNEVFPHVRRERWLTIKILEETADFVFQAFFQKNLDFDHINYDDDSFNPYRFYAGELHNTLHLFTMMIILQKIFRRTFKFNFLNDPNFELYHSTGRRISGITGDVYVWFFKTYKMVFLIYMDHFTGKLVFRYVPYTVDANTAAIDAGFTFESLKKSLQRFDSLSDLWLFLLFLTENERTTKMGLLPYVDFPISRVPFRPVIGSTEHARNCFTHGNNIYAKYEDLGKFFINEPIFQTAQAGNRHNDKTVLFNAVFVLTCFVENKDDPQDIYGVFINSLGTEMIYPYSRFKKFEIRDYGRDLVGQLVDCFKFTCISRHFDGFDWERWKFILSETEDKA